VADEALPTSTPAAEGLDPKVLDRFDADIAAGKYGKVDSMLVIRHGKIVFDRAYTHEYYDLLVVFTGWNILPNRPSLSPRAAIDRVLEAVPNRR
jgi:hypothetical protein